MNMDNPALEQHLDQLSEDEEIEQFVKSELRDLAHTRWLLGNRNKDLYLAQQQLETTPEYAEMRGILEEINTLKKAETELKDHVTNDALRLSEFSGYEDRKPVSGVQIKEFTVVNVTDEKQAKIWAANNAPRTISISKAKFNKAVKVLELDFIEIETEYRVQVASDLSEYLDE